MASALRNDFPDLPLVTQVVADRNVIVKVSDESGNAKVFEEKRCNLCR